MTLAPAGTLKAGDTVIHNGGITLLSASSTLLTEASPNAKVEVTTETWERISASVR